MAIRCQIISRYKIVFDGMADLVQLPTITGQIGVMEHHVRLYAKLQNGIITVRSGDDEQHFTSTGGIAEVKPTAVWVLADSSENVDDIDLERAEAARNRALNVMQEASSAHSMEFMKAMMRMKKATLRMRAGRKYKRGPKRLR